MSHTNSSFLSILLTYFNSATIPPFSQVAAAYDVVAVDNNNIVGEGVDILCNADVPDNHIVEEGVGSYIAVRVPDVDNGAFYILLL